MLTVVSGPDIYLTPLCSTLLAAGLAADAIFQFGNNVLPGQILPIVFVSLHPCALSRSDKIRPDRHGLFFPARTQILRREKGNLSRRHLDFLETRNLKLYFEKRTSTGVGISDVTLILGIVDIGELNVT